MNPTRHIRVVAALTLALLAACSDSSEPTATTEANLSTAFSTERIPTRAEEHPDGWTTQSDGALWQRLTETDTTAIVGLRAHGAPRGVWRNQLLLSRSEWTDAHNALISQPGVTLLAQDDVLPAILVKVADQATLAAIRKLPVVDYVEPAIMDPVGDGWASGCSDGDPWSSSTTIAGGDLVAQSFIDMGIERAWLRAPGGAGMTIGLIDTGIATTQDQLQSNFTSGESTDRWVRDYWVNGTQGQCSHGTRMAGVIGAPKNGSGAVGVAWKANLASVTHADNVYNLEGWYAAQGIRKGIDNGAQIVTLAFQVEQESFYVEDEIRWQYNNTQVLFIGAAGTSTWILPNANVVFPAEMAEVFAVTGSDPLNPDEPCGDCHFGDKVELAAIITQATHGKDAGSMTDIKGSSVAAAVISGIAALIWQRYPGSSRAYVVDRLRYSGKRGVKGPEIGYGTTNAMKALGGMYHVTVSGQTEFLTSTEVTETYSLQPNGGDGPFSYYWDATGSTESSATFSFPAPAPGVTEEYHLPWKVTDHSDGNVISWGTKVRVTGCDPTSKEYPCNN